MKQELRCSAASLEGVCEAVVAAVVRGRVGRQCMEDKHSDDTNSNTSNDTYKFNTHNDNDNNGTNATKRNNTNA